VHSSVVKINLHAPKLQTQCVLMALDAVLGALLASPQVVWVSAQ